MRKIIIPNEFFIFSFQLFRVQDMFLYSVLPMNPRAAFLLFFLEVLFSFWTGFIVLSYPPMIHHISFAQPDSIFTVFDPSSLWGTCSRAFWTFSHPLFPSKLFLSLHLYWHSSPFHLDNVQSQVHGDQASHMSVLKSSHRENWIKKGQAETITSQETF